MNDKHHIHLKMATVDEIGARIFSGVPRSKKYLVAMLPKGGAQLTENEVHAVAAYVFSIDRSHEPHTTKHLAALSNLDLLIR